MAALGARPEKQSIWLGYSIPKANTPGLFIIETRKVHCIEMQCNVMQ